LGLVVVLEATGVFLGSTQRLFHTWNCKLKYDTIIDKASWLQD